VSSRKRYTPPAVFLSGGVGARKFVYKLKFKPFKAILLILRVQDGIINLKIILIYIINI
jgi:hypothetical protein